MPWGPGPRPRLSLSPPEGGHELRVFVPDAGVSPTFVTTLGGE